MIVLIILFSILVVLAFVAICIVFGVKLNRAKYFKKHANQYEIEKAKEKCKKYKFITNLFIVLASITFIVFLIFPCGLYQIDSGEAVVIKEYGKAVDVKTSGLNWRFWPKTSIVKYNTKNQESLSQFESYSNDAQTMTVELVLQYKVKTNELLDVNINYGTLDALSSKISSIVIEKTKVVLSEYSAMEIIEKRSELSAKVQDQITKAISQYHVDITMVVIKDIAFNDAFENAVEQKMIAEQQKLQAQYDKETAIIKAEQQLEVAKREAEAELAKAEATAQAQIKIAEAEAEKIKLKSIEIARMLGFNILENNEIDITGKSPEEIKVISDYLQYAEYLAKWDGELPDVVGGDSTSVYIPNTNPTE